MCTAGARSLVVAEVTSCATAPATCEGASGCVNTVAEVASGGTGPATCESTFGEGDAVDHTNNDPSAHVPDLNGAHAVGAHAAPFIGGSVSSGARCRVERGAL